MMRKTIWLLAALILLLGIFPAASGAAPLLNLSWRAEYYDNPALSGQPKLSRFEDSVSHDWGYDAPNPELPADQFSARYTITRHFEKGTYLFLLTVDDGARVWLDGELIIDAWNVGRQENIRQRVFLEKSGNHELQVAYFEDTGRALIDFSWIQLAGGTDVVGAWQGEYFNNRDLAGDPVLVRQDSQINFDWNSGSPSPKVPRDNFSVRWMKSVYLVQGDYQLRIQHDDGMRVFVDGKNVYDSWKDQSVTYETITLRLETDTHDFKVEYYEHLSNAIAVMLIDDDPGDYTDGDDDGSEPSPGDSVIVDNRHSGFEWGGPLASRFRGCGGGYGADFYWTYNNSYRWENYGLWMPDLAAGDYEVYAYIPSQCATTRAARYQVHHEDDVDFRVVNQYIHSGWVSLGTYSFDGQSDEYVILYDSTSEPAASTQIAFDAIKFVPR